MAVGDGSEAELWGGDWDREMLWRRRAHLGAAGPGQGNARALIRNAPAAKTWTCADLDVPTWDFLCGFSCPGVSGKIHCESEPQAGQPCCEWETGSWRQQNGWGRTDQGLDSDLSISSNRSSWMLPNTPCSSKSRLWSRSEMGGERAFLLRNQPSISLPTGPLPEEER